MTLYYDEDRDAPIENHPDDWMDIDDEGRMVFDLSNRQKRDSLSHAAEAAAEAHEPPVDVGDGVAFVDDEGDEHDAVVTEVWNEGCINLVHAEDGTLVHRTSVVAETPDTDTWCWYA